MFLRSSKSRQKLPLARRGILQQSSSPSARFHPFDMWRGCPWAAANWPHEHDIFELSTARVMAVFGSWRRRDVTWKAGEGCLRLVVGKAACGRQAREGAAAQPAAHRARPCAETATGAPSHHRLKTFTRCLAPPLLHHLTPHYLFVRRLSSLLHPPRSAIPCCRLDNQHCLSDSHPPPPPSPPPLTRTPPPPPSAH